MANANDKATVVALNETDSKGRVVSRGIYLRGYGGNEVVPLYFRVHFQCLKNGEKFGATQGYDQFSTLAEAEAKFTEQVKKAEKIAAKNAAKVAAEQ